MVGHTTKLKKALRYFGRCGQYGGISGVTEYANAPVDSYRTGCPTTLSIEPEPVVGFFVVDVHRIKQSNQNIDVQKSDAHALIPQCVYKL